VEFIFIFAVILIEMLFVNLPEIMKIIGALWIYTFMDDEVFTVFYMSQVVITMRAFQNGSFGETVIFCWRKMCLADFAQNLAFLPAVIPHQVIHGSITCRAGTVFRDITFHTSKDRPDGFVVTFFVVRNKIFPIPSLSVRDDLWKLVCFEFLILWRVGVIKSPLPERDISADKVNEPTNLFMLVLNELK
jgi:hypothetical protein